MFGACAPTGDFGRVEPSLYHDRVMPLIGAANALNRSEAVTFLPLTDNEKALRARAYTLVVARDILGPRQAVKPYLRYHNVVRPWPHTTPVNAYHDRLLASRFAATDTRFSRVLSDMRKDLDALGPFERSAQAVLADDALRRRVIATEPVIAARSLKGAEARMTDNQRVIGLVVATMTHRLDIYAYALRHLAVETPTRRMTSLEAAFTRLETAVNTMASGFTGETALARQMRDGQPLVLLGRSGDNHGAGPQRYSLARPR